MNAHYNDDLGQRMFILWMMACLVIYGNNATLVDEDIDALRTTVGAYIVARVSGAFAHTLFSFADYKHRVQQRLYVGFTIFGLLLFIPLFFESVSIRGKIAVAFVAIGVEEVLWVLAFSNFPKKHFKLHYSTAVDINHEIDRYAALYIVVLGEFLYKIVVGSPAAVGFNLGAMRAIWTLIIAFCLNWLYLHCDGALESVHPIRRSMFAAFSWNLLHLPLIAGLLVGGHVAAVSAGTDELHEGELWVLCGGLAVGLFILWVFTLLHKSKDDPKLLYLPKVRTACVT
jgi:low temperature requirement protein LtrA